MFLNAIMLAGLGGAVVPLVLHLLSRARHRSVDWGAMMFLDGPADRRRQSTRLKQIILLLMRMAIVAVLAVALARPIVSGKWGALAQQGSETAVIILDRSASMGYDENGRSRLDLARDAILQVLSTLHKGDRVAILSAGSAARESLPDPTSDLQSVATNIASVSVSFGQADIADALSKAAIVLDRNPSLNREIYVVCDKQASSWAKINTGFANTWRSRSTSAGGQTRLFVIPVGGEERDNVAIDSIQVKSPPIIRNAPADVEIRIRNYGPTPRPSLPVTLTINGHEGRTLNVSLGADEGASISTSLTLSESGSQVISAAIKTSGLTSDDRLDAAVDVIDPVKVLIISGDEKPGAFHAESAFPKLALAPFATSGHHGADPAAVSVIASEKFADAELDKFDVVILANVPQLSTEQAHSIEQYVWGGGGVLIAPGSLCRPDNYNTMLYRNGSGVLPAKLSTPATPEKSQATTLLGIDLNHPIFQFLQGRPDPIPSATVGRFFPATPRPGDARVLASYVGGQPFLVDASSGRGRVLLLTTPLDADWNNLPLTSFYLPFLQSAVRYLATTGQPSRNLLVGEPIVVKIPDPVEDRNAHMIAPDGRRDPIEFRHVAGLAEARYTGTELPGVYRLRYRADGKDRALHYVLRAPASESDLTPLTSDRWQQLQADLGFERLDPAAGPLTASLDARRSGKELWPSLLAAVLMLGMGEMFLARLWSTEAA